MSAYYRHGDRVPTEVLCARMQELVAATVEGRHGEFTMRIPAELDRDADLVLSEAAKRLRELEACLAEALPEWEATYYGDELPDHWSTRARHLLGKVT
jgi:hypothetical protein